MKKDKKVMFTTQMDESLKKAFVQACENQDTTASQEVRAFARKYVAKHGQQKLI